MQNLSKNERIILSRACSYIAKANDLLNKLRPFLEKTHDVCKNCKKSHLRKGSQPDGMEYGTKKKEL